MRIAYTTLMSGANKTEKSDFFFFFLQFVALQSYMLYYYNLQPLKDDMKYI